MENENQKLDIKINKEDLSLMNYVLNNVNTRLVFDRDVIDKLVNKRILEKISKKSYNEKYQAIIKQSKEKLFIFKDKFSKLYIINEIYKKISGESINLYSEVYFDHVLSCLIKSLKIEELPINILNNITNFNELNLLNELANFDFDLYIDNNINKSAILSIKKILDKINAQKRYNNKSIEKIKKM